MWTWLVVVTAACRDNKMGSRVLARVVVIKRIKYNASHWTRTKEVGTRFSPRLRAKPQTEGGGASKEAEEEEGEEQYMYH